MKAALCLLSLSLLSLPLPAIAGGATLYVSTLGSDDTNNCLTLASPCLTIVHAIAEASPGDTILVAEGKYKGTNTLTDFGDLTIDGNWNETFNVQSTDTPTTLSAKKAPAFDMLFSGSTTAQITLKHLTIANCKWNGSVGPDGGGGALNINAIDSATVAIVLDGVILKSNSANIGGAVAFIGYDGTNVSLSVKDSLVTKNKSNVATILFEAVSGGSLTITNSVFSKNTGNAVNSYGSGAVNQTFDRVTFDGNKGTALYSQTIFANLQLSLTNSVFTKNRSDLFYATGLDLRTVSSNATVTTTNNTFSRNTFSGDFPDGVKAIVHEHVQDATLVHTSTNDLMFSEAGENAAALLLEGSGSFTFNRSYGDFGPFETIGAVQIVDGASVLAVDPQFVKAGKNVHLRDGSPAIDTGTCTGAPATDRDGHPRPQSGGCDMGAYER